MIRVWCPIPALVCAVLWSLEASAQSAEGLPGTERYEEIEATKLTKLPKQTKFVSAAYPPEAEKQEIEAEVVLLLDIDAEGKVSAVGVAEPANPPNQGFDEAAMVAAQQFVFEPAELDGKPVAVQITYRYRFTLALKAKPVMDSPPIAPPSTGQHAASKAEPVQVAGAAPGTANLRGLVRERGTRLPMPGVLVTVFRDDGPELVGFEATTDAEGRFQFVDLASGSWNFVVEEPGYYRFRTSEELVQREVVNVTYYVERSSYNPFDVTVTATRSKKEVSRTVITAEEADKVPGGIGDPLAVVRNFAGVARTDNPGVLIVRGSDPADSQSLIEGTRVPLIYHFGGLRTIMPAGVLDSIEFYPGNFSPEYGHATGGIVDVSIKKLTPKKLGGYADVSILDAGIYLEAPVSDNVAVAAAGRRSYVDFFIENLVPSDAGVDMISAPRYYDYQVLANYRPTPEHEFRGIFFGSDDRFELLFDNPADIDSSLTENDLGYSTSLYRGILVYRYVPNETFKNTLKFSLGKDWTNMDVAQFTVDTDVVSAEIREKAECEFDRHFAIHAGFDVRYTKSDMLLRMPRMESEGNPGGFGLDEETLENPITSQLDNVSDWYPGAFVEASLTPGRGFALLPGLRVDHYGMTDETSLQPRLSGLWEFVKDTTLKGGLGLFTREAEFLEVDARFGNPDLKPERAIHYSVGLEHKLRPYLTLDGTLFYKRLTNQVSPTDRVVDDGGQSRPLIYDNGGSGRVRGLELVVSHDLSRGLSGWVNYTLSQSSRLDSGETKERPFAWDQTHVVNVVAGYVLPKNWQVSARFRLSTGRPSTPVEAAVFDAGRDEYEPTYGDMFSTRERTFHQFDLRVDKRWIYDSWMLTTYLDVQNVYNNANPIGVEYNYDFRESQAQQGLPLLPIIGLRGEF